MILLSWFLLVWYPQGRATLLFLSSRKNYQRKLSCTPRLSRYSFLARSRSSSVGAVLNFPYRSRMTILSNFFSSSYLISLSQLSSSTKWKRSNCINNSCDICTFPILSILSVTVRDGMWQLWRLFWYRPAVKNTVTTVTYCHAFSVLSFQSLSFRPSWTRSLRKRIPCSVYNRPARTFSFLVITCGWMSTFISATSAVGEPSQ